ncbi:hypothetical protein OHD55_23445 [Escherichia coli]|nr:hypothetical protein [Escherichia coli]MCW7199320.1 hypothetical protein [Escherichia coli]
MHRQHNKKKPATDLKKKTLAKRPYMFVETYFFTDSNDACQYIINMRIVSVTDALLRKKNSQH